MELVRKLWEVIDIDYRKVNDEINSLILSGIVKPSIGNAKKAIPIKIESVNYHATRRGISVEEAQGFVDNAEIMFDQANRYMYLAKDGSATVIIENKRLISVYRKKDFDPAIMAILEVLDNAR